MENLNFGKLLEVRQVLTLWERDQITSPLTNTL